MSCRMHQRSEPDATEDETAVQRAEGRGATRVGPGEEGSGERVLHEAGAHGSRRIAREVSLCRSRRHPRSTSVGTPREQRG